MLVNNPRAFCGEIGIDKVAKYWPTGIVEFDLQLEAFKAQLALAARLKRPVSVHCVQAHGALVDILRAAKDELPPAIALHSFSGKVDECALLPT
jgi:TatD DNase family protein